MSSNDLNSSIDIWSLDLEQHQQHILQYQALLNNAELEKALRFRKREDQNRSIISYGVLRILLGHHLQIRPEKIQLEKNEFGKPYSKDNPIYQFNLSHSHFRVVIAITRHTPIGIDIEYMQKNEAMDKIAKRFFSAQEYEEYLSLPSDEKTRGFYHAWTRKEAFIKAIGTGRHFPLSDFDVSLSPRLPPKIYAIRGAYSQEDASDWNLHSSSDLKNYAMALCYKGPPKKAVSYKL